MNGPFQTISSVLQVPGSVRPGANVGKRKYGALTAKTILVK